ncbi:hypothetical protein RKD05_000587 [Microbacterium sp. SLBN-111]
MADDAVDGRNRVPLECVPHLGRLRDGIHEVVVAAGSSPRARALSRGCPRQGAPVSSAPHRVGLLAEETGELADGEGRVQEVGAHVEHGAPMRRRGAQDRHARCEQVFIESAGPMGIEVEPVSAADLDDPGFRRAPRTGRRTGTADDGRDQVRLRETRPEQMLEEGRPDRVGGAHDENTRRRCGDDGTAFQDGAGNPPAPPVHRPRPTSARTPVRARTSRAGVKHRTWPVPPPGFRRKGLSDSGILGQDPPQLCGTAGAQRDAAARHLDHDPVVHVIRMAQHAHLHIGVPSATSLVDTAHAGREADARAPVRLVVGMDRAAVQRRTPREPAARGRGTGMDIGIAHAEHLSLRVTREGDPIIGGHRGSEARASDTAVSDRARCPPAAPGAGRQDRSPAPLPG